MSEEEKIAREALIVYNQLNDFRNMLEKHDYAEKKDIYLSDGAVRNNFNALLRKIREIFQKVDESFLNSINHIKELPRAGEDNSYEIIFAPAKVNLPIITGALNTFLQLYLAPEDKKKIIGFVPPEK